MMNIKTIPKQKKNISYLFLSFVQFDIGIGVARANQLPLKILYFYKNC